MIYKRRCCTRRFGQRISQENIERTTKYPESLKEIQRKQNERQGLTHVRDEAFEFFLVVEALTSEHISMEALAKEKSKTRCC